MLTVKELNISYGAVHALRGVSLDVGSNEIVALLGANGAGKSSLLRGITGLAAPQSGSVTFKDRSLQGKSAAQRVSAGIAMAPEGRQVFADQTVHENLLLGGHLIRADRTLLLKRVESMFQMFPRLRERREQLSGTLSGGEQQMLAIARALMSGPSLLILDEPSLGLAPIITADIFRSLLRLRREGMAILLVEQMANQALAVADRAYVLEGGRVVLHGSASELKNDPRIRAAYLGGMNGNKQPH